MSQYKRELAQHLISCVGKMADVTRLKRQEIVMAKKHYSF
jgi:hypothetical protein